MRVPRAVLRLVWAYHRFLDRVSGGRFDSARFGDPIVVLEPTGPTPQPEQATAPEAGR